MSTCYNALHELFLLTSSLFCCIHGLSFFLAFSYQYSYFTLLTTSIHVHTEPLRLNRYSRCLLFPLLFFALLEEEVIVAREVFC